MFSLQWSEEDLLQYLADWGKWVNDEKPIPKEAKPFSILRQQTLEFAVRWHNYKYKH